MTWDPVVAGRAHRLLTNSTFELIPLDDAFDHVAHLPAGARVSVTASPTRGVEATIALTTRLIDAGFDAIPHLAARHIDDLSRLAEIVHHLAGSGVQSVFVVAGDGEPRGDLTDSLELISAMEHIGHPFDIGVAGYPEGHPAIDDDALRTALRRKADVANTITTQMCFDSHAIESWTRATRAEGVGLPVVVGIPGVVDALRLTRIARRIGVGESVRFLFRHRSTMGKLLSSGRYTPGSLVRSVASLDTENLGLDGFHLFTFNQVEATVEWYLRALEELRADT